MLILKNLLIPLIGLTQHERDLQTLDGIQVISHGVVSQAVFSTSNSLEPFLELKISPGLSRI